MIHNGMSDMSAVRNVFLREDKDEQGVPFEKLVEELGFSLEDLKSASMKV